MTVVGFRLKNFMTFQDSGWMELRPLTLIYGRNSVGKSNLHRAFELLQNDLNDYVSETSLGTHKHPFRLKSYSKYFSDDLIKNSVTFCFRITLLAGFLTGSNIVSEDQPTEIYLNFTENTTSHYYELSSFSIELSESIDDKSVVVGGKKDIVENSAKWILKSDWLEIYEAEDNVWSNIDIDFDFFPQIIAKSGNLDELLKIKVVIDEEGKIAYDKYGEFIYEGDDAKEETRSPKNEAAFIRKIFFLIKTDISSFLESYRYVGFNRINLNTSNACSSSASDWSNRVIYGDQSKNFASTNNKHLATGAKIVNQYFTLLLDSEKDKYCYFDHPEAFLHPASQAGMADFLINAGYEKGINLIVETHSELLLLRLMKRIKQLGKRISLPVYLEYIRDIDKLDPLSKRISIIVVTGDVFGYSKSTTLYLDDLGELQKTTWPNGFFEEGFFERLIVK